MAADERYIYWIARARHRLFSALDEALLAAAEVTTAQSAALFWLRKRDGARLSELSRGLDLDNSAITGMVDRLEKKGLVRRERIPGDRRATGVWLTPAGRETAERALPVVNDFNARVAEGFSDAELDAFMRVLRAIGRRFGGEGADEDVGAAS